MPEQKARGSRARLAAGLIWLLLLLAISLAGCTGNAAGTPGPEETPDVVLPATQPLESSGGVPTPPAVTPGSTAIPPPGDDDDHYTEIEFRGTLSAVQGDVWTVNNQQVIVPGSMGLVGIQVGDYVKVEAWLGPDGQLTAREIELEDDDRDDDDDFDDDDFDDDDDWDDDSDDD